MCLTGVDYFSTLGYQPGIAALAAGALSPFATLVLVIVTLFGALPMYRRVAEESPHGDGSISMLERLLSFWQEKFLVLILIGFALTGFIITITLSAADATAHIVENPLVPHWMDQPVAVTLILIGLLGGIFLKGFKEAIGIAILLVGLYLVLSGVVIVNGFMEIARHPEVWQNWKQAVFSSHSWLSIFGTSFLLFPNLALGLSGFETGVLVMPQIQGRSSDTSEKPVGRIQNGKKLLTTAALIMSVLLLCSSLVTTLLIPAAAFKTGGEANGRALAYLAHEHLGPIFATAYDISTILILWFAGASAMAGLLNIVPRYLPKYGMAPEWTLASRPLVLIFTLIAFVVTIIFKADVNAQAAAYATGVLALMGSAAVATTLSAKHKSQRLLMGFFAAVTVIFAYTIAVNLYQDLGGLKIAGFFILLITFTSLISRVFRATELRVSEVTLDEDARRFVREEARHNHGRIRIIANRKNAGDEREYRLKEAQVRDDTHIPEDDVVLFLEISIDDASDFAHRLDLYGVQVGPHRILRGTSSSIPNALAAALLHIRDETGRIPHIYFGWTEGNPVLYLLRFMLFGEGDIAPVTREILRKAEPDPRHRPYVHVGG
ncbi:amino acid transporter [Deinococcus roseus]|uniref:Amino acid transporter n=2 Tax=Deinococcus roseus TaxID=392414 RepID=A0ABQ2CYZ2_9DEIO|nr:amino acid transporter [Deinococcus roseus]